MDHHNGFAGGDAYFTGVIDALLAIGWKVRYYIKTSVRQDYDF